MTGSSASSKTVPVLTVSQADCLTIQECGRALLYQRIRPSCLVTASKRNCPSPHTNKFEAFVFRLYCHLCTTSLCSNSMIPTDSPSFSSYSTHSPSERSTFSNFCPDVVVTRNPSCDSITNKLYAYACSCLPCDASAEHARSRW